MRKLWISLMTLVLSLFLVACGASETGKQTDNKKIEAQMTIVYPEETFHATIEVEAGTSVMAALSEVQKIEENQGMITSIGGVSQDEAKQTYWMYKVNGKVAPKGANETQVKAGDEIEFYQETFK